MADIKQGVEYEFSAKDSTQAVADAVMKRMEDLHKKEEEIRAKQRAAEKERKEEAEKQNAQLQKSKSLLQAVGAAASGGWSAVAKVLGVAVLGAKKFNAAMMKFAPYAALVAGVVMLVRQLASAFSAARERAEKIQFENVKAGIESSRKHIEAFNAALDITKAKQESAAEIVDRQIEATKTLTDAQDEYNKALELSIAKSDEERKAIEEKYGILKAASDKESAAAKRANDRKRLESDIADKEERLAEWRANYRENQDTFTRMQSQGSKNAQRIGFWNGVGSYFTASESAASRAKRQLEAAHDAAEQANAAQKEIKKLETELAAAKELLGQMDTRDQAASLTEELEDRKRRKEKKGFDIEEERKNAAAVTAERYRELDSLQQLTKAQVEYDRVRELALAKTDKERQAVETKYKSIGLHNEREVSARRREIERDALDGEIKLLQAEIENSKDDTKRVLDLERALADARHRRGQLDVKEEVAQYSDANELQTEFNEAWKEADDAEKEEIETVKKQAIEAAEEVKAAQLAAAKAVKDTRMRDLREATEAETAAQQRLAAARQAVDRAWGWYRDKDSLRAQLEEEKADAAAQAQYEKDFERLRFRHDWREAKDLSLDQEAVRRVALAREEEASAQRAVEETAENTRRAAQALEEIQQGLMED